MIESSFEGVGGLKIATRSWKPAGSQYFHDHAGSTDKTLKLYEGHFHDLLADLDREIVMADIQSWLDARIR